MMTGQDKPTRYPTAFSGIQAVSEVGLEITNQVHEEMTVLWDSLQLIRVQMGQQAYDMTPTLRIELTVARDIFLAEGHSLWEPFIQAVDKYLLDAMPSAVWRMRLAKNPDLGFVVYKRPVLQDLPPRLTFCLPLSLGVWTRLDVPSRLQKS